jgi:hypothetical protein
LEISVDANRNPTPIEAIVLLISAVASGQGKTAVTATLARKLVQQGRRVRVFKTGSDFLDPILLERVSGAPVHTRFVDRRPARGSAPRAGYHHRFLVRQEISTSIAQDPTQLGRHSGGQKQHGIRNKIRRHPVARPSCSNGRLAEDRRADCALAGVAGWLTFGCNGGHGFVPMLDFSDLTALIANLHLLSL